MYRSTPQTRQKALRVFQEMPTENLIALAVKLPTSGGSRYALTELQRQIEKDVIAQKQMFVTEEDKQYDENKRTRQQFSLSESLQRAQGNEKWNPKIPAPGHDPGPSVQRNEQRLTLKSAATEEMLHQKPVVKSEEQSKQIARQSLQTNRKDEYDNSEIYSDGGGGSGLPF